MEKVIAREIAGIERVGALRTENERVAEDGVDFRAAAEADNARARVEDARVGSVGIEHATVIAGAQIDRVIAEAGKDEDGTVRRRNRVIATTALQRIVARSTAQAVRAVQTRYFVGCRIACQGVDVVATRQVFDTGERVIAVRPADCAQRQVDRNAPGGDRIGDTVTPIATV